MDEESFSTQGEEICITLEDERLTTLMRKIKSNDPSTSRLNLRDSSQDRQPISPNADYLKNIEEAIALSTTLKTIELSLESIDVFLAFLRGLKQNGSVTELVLLGRHSGANVDKAMRDLVESSVSVVERLITRVYSNSTLQSLLTGLRKNSSITNLEFHQGQDLNIRLCTAEWFLLKGLLQQQTTSLSRLSLSGVPLTNEGFEVLAQGLFRKSNLRELDVANTDIEGVRAAKTLRDILRRNKGLVVVDVGFNRLDIGPMVQILKLIGTGLGENDSVEDLAMSGCFYTGEDDANAWSAFTTRAFTCSAFRMGERRGRKVSSYVSLPTCLHLDWSEIGASGAGAIVRVLHDSWYAYITKKQDKRKWSNIRFFEQLDFSDIRLSDDGGRLIAGLLHPMTQVLNDWHGNNRGEREITELPCASYPLRVLSLNCTDFRDNALIAVAKALENNTSLQMLELVGCQFSERVLIAIEKALENNTSLQELDLNVAHQFSKSVIKSLSKSLGRMKHLKRLSFTCAGFPFPSDTIPELLVGLEQNTSLVRAKIFDMDGTYDIDEMEFYTQRNMYRPLLTCSSAVRTEGKNKPAQGIWSHALAAAQSNPSVLYYLLREKSGDFVPQTLAVPWNPRKRKHTSCED